jgi:hypothetical protein
MKLLPYTLFVYFNGALSILLILIPLLLAETNTPKIVLGIAGLVMLITLSLSKEITIPKFNILNQRIVALVVFLLAIFINLSPYLASFVVNTGLVVSAISISMLSLISLFLTNFDKNIEE